MEAEFCSARKHLKTKFDENLQKLELSRNGGGECWPSFEPPEDRVTPSRVPNGPLALAGPLTYLKILAMGPWPQIHATGGTLDCLNCLISKQYVHCVLVGEVASSPWLS